MEITKARGGKKNRKFGRRKNKPCQKRYTSEKRWKKNKLRKAQKYANKFGTIKIKIDGEWVIVKPK